MWRLQKEIYGSAGRNGPNSMVFRSYALEDPDS